MILDDTYLFYYSLVADLVGEVKGMKIIFNDETQTTEHIMAGLQIDRFVTTAALNTWLRIHNLCIH